MGNRYIQAYEEQVAGLAYKGAPGHVFQLRHVRADLAWNWQKNEWVKYADGSVYTYDAAVMAGIDNAVPTSGRWYAIGLNLYSVE